MLRVALTGGLCSGKSTVAGWLTEWGVPVINADLIGHELLDPEGVAYAPVVGAFGNGILNAAGRIDRRLLAQRAFADASMLLRLNAILHPPIVAALESRLRDLAARDTPLAVVEAALFVEEGLYRRFDRLVVVTCTTEQKIARFVGRGGGSRAEAEARLAAQWPDDEKARHADFLIDNSGDLAATRRQTADLYVALRSQAGGEPGN